MSKRSFHSLTAVLLAAIGATSCSSIDCPLNNTVMANIRLAGDSVLDDTLSVYATRHNATDTLLVNRSIGVDSLLVPVSYSGDEDVLRLVWHTPGLETYTDTLTIGKTNEPHFESVDCSPTFFHTITSAATTRHRADSVAVKRTTVDYNTTSSHLIIYVSTHE